MAISKYKWYDDFLDGMVSWKDYRVEEMILSLE